MQNPQPPNNNPNPPANPATKPVNKPLHDYFTNQTKQQQLMTIAQHLGSQGFIATSLISSQINAPLLTYIQSASQINIQAIYQGLLKMFNLVQ